jgi:hypothetical protein
MAEQKQRKKDSFVKGSFDFVEIKPDEQPPDLKMELIDPSGRRTPIELQGYKNFELDPQFAGKGYSLEIQSHRAKGGKRRFNYDSFLRTVQSEGTFHLAEPVWKALLFYQICVSGQVRVCRPWFLNLDLTAAAVARPFAAEIAGGMHFESHAAGNIIGPVRPVICYPVCEGKVEVFIRTCCCPVIGPLDPPIVIRHICEIIDCTRFEAMPELPPHDPGPIGPGPHPGPDPAPMLGRATTRALKRATAVEGAANAERVLRMSEHLTALRSMAIADQVRYVEAHEELKALICFCSTAKVAEVPLQADGHFDACFPGFFLHHRCTRRVLYRVSQMQGGSWVVIYDGLARNESFELDELAVLRADSNAQSCDPPIDWPALPFVLLEQIGSTYSDTLIHSTQQTGETQFGGPLAATDGLANAAPMGPIPVTAGPYDQPWGATLALRYRFHPGLFGLGARYYRTRVIRVDGAGAPMGGGANFTITAGLSWAKYYAQPGGEVGVQWVPLNNAAINGVEGLYTIPFEDLMFPWLGGQFHAHIVTNEVVDGSPRMPNGRYLFVVDVFDAAGQRIVPDNSLEGTAPGEVDAAFVYRRLDGPIDDPVSNTSVVPHSALANLFLVDNLSCFADIEQIVDNGVPSMTNCQFLSGPSTDTLQLRYSAYQNNGYQWYHRIRYKQGLTGPTTWLPASNANVNSGDSPVLTFGDLLGSESRCAFAANLYVYAKHTNGSGRINAYDREDVAAFALEVE